jgi:hypothetical protein
MEYTLDTYPIAPSGISILTLFFRFRIESNVCTILTVNEDRNDQINLLKGKS